MDHTTTQLDAVCVLSWIIYRAQEAGLPDLSWDLPHYAAQVKAQFPATADDETKTIGMAAWGAHLGVKAEAKRYHDRGYTELEITTEVDDIPVEIFCHVDRSATYGQTGGAK